MDHAPEKWDIIPSGFCEGGVGLYASIRDIENLGLLYMNNGMINGKQILSRQWVEMATSKQIDNSNNGTADWCSGYGYQFWKNSRDGQRSDGAFGQLCFMLPSSNTLVSVQCECRSEMQKEVDEIYALANEIEVKGEDISEEELHKFVNEFYAPTATIKGSLSFLNKKYAISENPIGIKYIDFIESDEEIIARIFTEGNTEYIRGGFTAHITNTVHLKAFKPTLTGLIPTRYEKCVFACNIIQASENKLIYNFRYKNAPHSGLICISSSDNNITIEFKPQTGGMIDNAKVLTGIEI